MALLSHWKEVQLRRFPSLENNLQVDVLVVGGGITGISTAYLLKKAGRNVALIERDRCVQGDTGNTTSHLTCVTDERLPDLVKDLGRDHAQAVWDSGLAAIEQIQAIVTAEKIPCEFARVPGFLISSLDGDRDESSDLTRDADLANELGFPAHYVESAPIFNRPGVRYPNQAQFHPLKYLAGLLDRLHAVGCPVFEETEAKEFERDAKQDVVSVKANGYTIQCKTVIIATHVPLMGLSDPASATLLQSKVAPYTSYVIGASMPRGAMPEILFWDTSDPYYYLRIDRDRDRDVLIFGGVDHKTGQATQTSDRFKSLEEMLHRFLPKAVPESHWSGKVLECADGLPLIGFNTERQFVATGFAGNGMTFGTLSAMMACDAVIGRENPWRELFDPTRKKTRGGAWTYIKENLEYPYYMIKDRLAASEGKSLESLGRGEGKILRLDGKRVAAYRDEFGKTCVLSAVCTHMGCIVHWNEAEKSWDCPCHGSRFQPTGEVIAGPAETPLEAEPGK